MTWLSWHALGRLESNPHSQSLTICSSYLIFHPVIKPNNFKKKTLNLTSFWSPLDLGILSRSSIFLWPRPVSVFLSIPHYTPVGILRSRSRYLKKNFNHHFLLPPWSVFIASHWSTLNLMNGIHFYCLKPL